MPHAHSVVGVIGRGKVKGGRVRAEGQKDGEKQGGGI